MVMSKTESALQKTAKRKGHSIEQWVAQCKKNLYCPVDHSSRKPATRERMKEEENQSDHYPGPQPMNYQTNQSNWFIQIQLHTRNCFWEKRISTCCDTYKVVIHFIYVYHLYLWNVQFGCRCHIWCYWHNHWNEDKLLCQLFVPCAFTVTLIFVLVFFYKEQIMQGQFEWSSFLSHQCR